MRIAQGWYICSPYGRLVSTSTEGVVTDVIVAIAPGTGQVFVNTVPLTGYDFQETARTAVNVAAARAHVNPNQYDFGFTIRGPMEIQVVDGPSAGLPMTVAAYSADDQETSESKRLQHR